MSSRSRYCTHPGSGSEHTRRKLSVLLPDEPRVFEVDVVLEVGDQRGFGIGDHRSTASADIIARPTP